MILGKRSIFLEYKCCDHILGSIDLSFSGFKYCNEVWEGPEYISYKGNDAFNKNEERRLKIIEEMKNGIIPERCKECPLLELKDWKEFDAKIYKITVFNWKHCNAACFYCSVHSDFNESIKKSDDYDSLPFIKKLIAEGRITEKSFIAFMGGEPTMLQEFPEILSLLIKKGCKLEVLTNGIKYEKLISDMLNAHNDNKICISLDCGTKETFKRIKRVDKFDEVINTLKQYIEDTKENSYKVRLKYIVLPNVNDNKKEIDKFFEVAKSIGITSVVRSVDHLESKMNTKNKAIETSVIKAYEYFAQQAKKYNMTLCEQNWADAIIENKVYNCRKISTLTKIKANLHFFFGKKNK